MRSPPILILPLFPPFPTLLSLPAARTAGLPFPLPFTLRPQLIGLLSLFSVSTQAHSDLPAQAVVS